MTSGLTRYFLFIFLAFMLLIECSCGSKNAGQGGKDNGLQLGFASSSIRFVEKDTLPDSTQAEWKVTAWRNEKVHAQIVIWAYKDLEDISIAVSDLKDGNGNSISKDQISIGRLGFVMTDEFRDGCGYRKPADFDSSRVADIIYASEKSFPQRKETLQPVWVSVMVPGDAKAGTYKGSITIKADAEYELAISLNVIDRTLPLPSEWSYQLDLWQHPAAIARVHKLELWSDAHFDAMKKYYTLLASAGQKVITTSITDEPWGHQTYDDYPSLVKWIKKKDGSWEYDYSLFDKYVEFVMSCGIKGRINCYSMVPWKIAFRYYDEEKGKEEVITDAVGTKGYEDYWRTMLIDFTKHLKEKNWFDITAIALDERPMPAMQVVIKLLKSIDADWKIALAGDYHPEIQRDIYDYCVASRWQLPDSILKERKEAGKVSTWYTCCVEAYPNGFTFSPPDEHVWMGYYTAAKGFDGYLRWAFNSWTRDPLSDSRFTAWPAGDTYQVYPGPFSSIRFETLIEGIQGYEKVQFLRKEFLKNGESEKLAALENSLKFFELKTLGDKSPSEMLEGVRKLVNE